jgi:hypothetical protein
MNETNGSPRRELAVVATWAVGAIAVFGAVAAALLLTVLSPESRDLRRCDGAIQATLVAPSTYRRIGAEALFNSRLYRVTYDAENAFGVPLRSSGECSLLSGVAVWSEGG